MTPGAAASIGPGPGPGLAGLAGLRITLVGPLPPPAGGMAHQTRQLAELLRSAQADVRIVATNAAYRPQWISTVPMLRAAFRLMPYLRDLWRAMGACDLVHVMANSGWAWHLFAVPAIWVARLRGRPSVVNYRGGEAAAFLQRSPRLVRFTLRGAARLIVPSKFLEQVFRRHGIAAQVVPNIVDLRLFHPGDAPRELRIVVARNLEAIYDNATALRAFALVVARHPACRMTIAGTGPEESSLKQLAADLGIAHAVDFAGRIEREAMAALLRRCRVALNPSLADNMPNSMLEALASGVPVISTAVGGVPFLVEDGRSALLVPARDASAMAAALLRVLDEPALAACLAQAGLALVRQYAWDEVAPLLGTAYGAALHAAPEVQHV